MASVGQFKGRVCIVTGAAGRLGSFIAKLIAAEGGTTIINDVIAEGAERLAEEIRADGYAASAKVIDATTLAGATRLVDDVVAEHGRIDAIVLAGANLAGQRYESIEQMSEEHFHEIVLSHAGGHFAMIKAVIPHMKRQRYGRILGFSSSTGMVGDWGFCHYSAGKGAVASLVRTAAIELDAWGITVNALCPAGTPGQANTPVLSQRTGPPAGVAPTAAYLVSEKAGYINGHIFEASGSGRIGLYNPFVPARHVHKPSGWTLDEVGEIMPGLFEVSYTNEPRQRPALVPRDPLLESLPGDMVDRLPTGLSPILTDGLNQLGLIEELGLPGYNQPGPHTKPGEG